MPTRTRSRKSPTSGRRKSRSRKSFDKYDHYLKAVQSPDVDVRFIAKTYRQLRDRPARVLREDFCGTFAICCEWTKLSPMNRSIGIDLDREPIHYGLEHHFKALSSDRQRRIRIHQASVLTARVEKADVIAAMNFSYFLFKSRLLLRQYFTRARKGLKSGGILLLDCFGGTDCQEANVESRRISGFKYFWDQKNFDPVSNEAKFAIHFQRPGEKQRRDVFEYDWRMWTIPEIRETLLEAGFLKTHVYWEGTTRTGDGDGVFKRSEKGEECAGWIAYVVGET